ncbi:MAG: hypothetical protein IJ735_03785, partial [Clostridia bacterium]|nr:hypothetical protein [Clostridia bacterium]
FLRLTEKQEELDLPYEKLENARKIYAIYNGGFCREITTPVFVKYKEELRAVVFRIFLSVAYDLIETGDFAIVYRILRTMESTDPGEEYRIRIEELKKRIKEKRNED